MQSFKHDDVEIAYLDEGDGSPVLLIHGFASNAATNWGETGWVRHLTREGYRVIAIDNRGHGASQKFYAPRDYHLGTMAEDARALLDHIGVEAAHIMGYSMGARITAFLALNHPPRVKTAVFGGLGIHMVHGFANAEPIAAALLAPSLDTVTNVDARGFRIFAEQTKSDRDALAACIRGTREAIPANIVARISCPMLVAVGSTDGIAGSGAELAAIIPGAQFLDIVGRDHMRAVGDRVYKDGVSAFFRANA